MNRIVTDILPHIREVNRIIDYCSNDTIAFEQAAALFVDGVRDICKLTVYSDINRKILNGNLFMYFVIPIRYQSNNYKL